MDAIVIGREFSPGIPLYTGSTVPDTSRSPVVLCVYLCICVFESLFIFERLYFTKNG